MRNFSVFLGLGALKRGRGKLRIDYRISEKLKSENVPLIAYRWALIFKDRFPSGLASLNAFYDYAVSITPSLKTNKKRFTKMLAPPFFTVHGDRVHCAAAYKVLGLKERPEYRGRRVNIEELTRGRDFRREIIRASAAGTVQPQKTIAKKTGLSLSTVKRATKTYRQRRILKISGYKDIEVKRLGIFKVLKLFTTIKGRGLFIDLAPRYFRGVNTRDKSEPGKVIPLEVRPEKLTEHDNRLLRFLGLPETYHYRT